MKTISIASWQEFEDRIFSNTKTEWGYRGVPVAAYDLIPAIGRPSVRISYNEKLEKEMFRRFKRQALPHLQQQPQTEFEWLAVAQHYGLPTRLLDWTLSPLTALFFALDAGTDQKVEDFAVYAYTGTIYEEVADPFSPGSDPHPEVYAPHQTTRIAAQQGYFILHREPTEPFRTSSLVKYQFAPSLRPTFTKNLNLLGVNRSALFPDLAGISQHLASWYRDSASFP